MTGRLSKTQLKELYDVFQQSGLSKRDFDIKSGEDLFEMKAKYSNFLFGLVRIQGNMFRVYYINIHRSAPTSDRINWELAKQMFNNWLIGVKREMHTVTGWEDIDTGLGNIPGLEEINQQFSTEEIARIQESIREVKEQLKALDLIAEHQQAIMVQLDRIETMAAEMNKFDWKSLFAGSLVNIATGFAFSQEARSSLGTYIQQAFIWMRTVPQLPG